MTRHRMLCILVSLGLFAAACGRGESGSPPTTAGSAGAVDAKCASEPLQATETGVTANTITVQVMADTGSALAPGLFQGNVDAIQGFEKYINDNGGIGCRKLKVETWDSKLTPDESKNGQINACKTALAMVGGNSLFNPDVTEMNTCADSKGAATGIPDVAALANDINEQCAKNAYIIQGIIETCPPGGGVPSGSRPLKGFVGPQKYYETLVPNGLTGLFLVPGDLPTTVQSGAVLVK